MIVWFYSLISVFIVSSISLVGALAFPLEREDLRKILLYLVGFSAGGLFGDVFIHLIPEAMKGNSDAAGVPLFIISGIIVSFIIERFLHWRHCHIPASEEHPHPFAYMNLFGDAVHNFIDGLIIGGSYSANISLGVATTIAVILHEIPQEIGDFGVLIYGGFHRSKALFLNFLSAIVAVFGTVVALGLGLLGQDLTPLLIPFAAGNFIYIAGSDLIPELHKDKPELSTSSLQLASFILGVLALYSLTLLE